MFNYIILIIFNKKVHTNPILISFLSILYYKDLQEYIRRYHFEKRQLREIETDKIELKMNTYNGKLDNLNGFNDIKNKRLYNKTILNRWFLYLQLSKNYDLIRYRGHNISKKEIPIDKPSLISKIKACKNKMCCCKKSKKVHEQTMF